MSVYRTAQGKMIDMSALATKNEKVRAVGNMHVNARGDTLDSNNQVINDSTRRTAASYQQTVQERVNNPAPPRMNPNRPVAQRRQVQQEQPVQQVVQQPKSSTQPARSSKAKVAEPIIAPEPIELTPEEQAFEDEDEDSK